METFDPSSISQFDLNGDEESFNQSDKVLDYSHIRLVLLIFQEVKKNQKKLFRKSRQSKSLFGFLHQSKNWPSVEIPIKINRKSRFSKIFSKFLGFNLASFNLKLSSP